MMADLFKKRFTKPTASPFEPIKTTTVVEDNNDSREKSTAASGSKKVSLQSN